MPTKTEVLMALDAEIGRVERRKMRILYPTGREDSGYTDTLSATDLAHRAVRLAEVNGALEVLKDFRATITGEPGFGPGLWLGGEES